MAAPRAHRHRRATLGLVLLTLVLGLLVFLAATHIPASTSLPVPTASAPSATTTVLFDRFSALWERSPDGERLHVSLRLRATTAADLPCFVFVLARNDHARPKVWAVWPPQQPGPAITSGGHFHGADPTKGYAVTLTGRWERINATLPHSPGVPPYETVLVYVVGTDGKVFLSRPFRL